MPGKQEFKMEDTNKMTIIDDNGNEKEATILFTFENEDTGKQYVVFTVDDPDVCYAYYYDDNGELTAIEDEEELDMCMEVLDAFDGENLI
jgi:uncharacterized protein YrzB (UPF0473 family)